MTLGTRKVGVGAGQWKFRRRAVIERRVGPRRGGMAHGAILRKTRRHVTGVVRSIPIGQMARNASRRKSGVHIVHVALSAGNRSMGPGQGELCRSVVIKGGASPIGGGMAKGTILRKTCSRVIRTGRLIVFRLVAGETLCRCSRKPVVGMALAAIDADVSARQRKCCLAVVKDGALPRGSRVTDLAILWETCRNVVRIGCLVKIRLVA